MFSKIRLLKMIYVAIQNDEGEVENADLSQSFPMPLLDVSDLLDGPGDISVLGVFDLPHLMLVDHGLAHEFP